MGLDAKWTELPSVQRRFLFFSAAVALVFLLLGLRLWYLQIISHADYQERSIRNRTRVLPLDAPRGWRREWVGILWTNRAIAAAVVTLGVGVGWRNFAMESSPTPKAT